MPLITKYQARKMGIRNPSLQTIQIPDTWSVSESKRWLQRHGYLWQYYRTTANFRRFAQTYDIDGATYYSKKIREWHCNGMAKVLIYQR